MPRGTRTGSRAASGVRRRPASAFRLRNAEVEAALLTGQHAGVLADYFGADRYARLRALARAAARPAGCGGRVAWILPGMMGSTIGRRGDGAGGDDVIWFDPVVVAAGGLEQLALRGEGKRLEALGVLLFAYLQLKLRLRMAGFDAQFYPFDWRLGIAELGEQLVRDLRERGGDPVSLVAHSMGALVARWALGDGGPCRRLVMLGPPSYGCFAPVLALRAVYPVVRMVAALDLVRSAEELTRGVFTTFPGLAQMLPSRERFRTVDLYDLAGWPQPDDGLRPRPDILSSVQAVQRALASGDERFAIIAGVEQETVTGLRKDDRGQFVYAVSRAGDGTVPLDLARMPGVPTYYVAEAHGSLPNNDLVGDAVIELLSRGTTTVLPTAYATPHEPLRQVPEAEVRTAVDAACGGTVLGPQGLSGLLEASAPVLSRDRRVVARGAVRRIELRFALGDITEVDARAVALGIFRGVTPSGAALALDRRLDGAIAELARRRMVSGTVGEIFLLPTRRYPISAELLAFVGLGAFDRFSGEAVRSAAENLVRTLIRARVEEFATVPFGAGSGEDPGASLRNLLVGVARGLRGADQEHCFRRLIVCERDHDRYGRLKEALCGIAERSLFPDVEFTVDEVVLAAPLARPSAAPALPPADPAYLIVAHEGSSDGAFRVRASVLTAGQKATVVTGAQTVREQAFEALRLRLVDPAVVSLTAEGARLARLLLSAEVRRLLGAMRAHHLVVVHDAPMSRVPWETLALPRDGRAAAWVPALGKGLSHCYAAESLSVAKWLEERRQDRALNVLLVVNPTADLAGADAEGTRVQALCADVAQCRLEVLRAGAATRTALLAAFGSGRYDVIHYAGHAFFDEARPERSGLVCHGGVPLTGLDLAGLGSLPTLVFVNACEAGRVGGSRVVRAARPRAARASDAVGVAEAFMRGGVANFLGTYWPVGDAAALRFAEVFYRRVLAGRSTGEAVREGRMALRHLGSKDWASYVFYGNPDFALKARAG